jgi:chromosome segregation ATPase
MNKGLVKNILIVLLVSMAIFSIFKYLLSLKEKYDLVNALNQVKEQVAALEKEKQDLLGELKKEKEFKEQLKREVSGFKGYLRASKKRLTKLFADYATAEKTIEELSSKVGLLKSENIALIKQRNKLSSQVTQISQENDSLKAKLNSISELKKAIRELKKKKTKVNVQISQDTEKTQMPRIVEGNRGFIIKDGKFTYPTRVKIEVTPVRQANNGRNF